MEGFADEEEAIQFGTDRRSVEAGRGRNAGGRGNPEGGISEQTLYRWMLKYVGLEVRQVRQMKLLQKENVRLQQLMAELTLARGRGANR